MSYILEALKKADQEHDIGAVPDLATLHEAERPQTRSYRLLWIIVTLLSVNAVLVVMLLKDKNAEGAEVAVTAQVQVPLERQTALTNDQLVQPIQQTSEAQISEAPAPGKPVLPGNESILSTGEVVVLPEPAYLQDSRLSILPEEESGRQMDAMTTAKDNSQLQSWYELPQELRNKLDLPRLDVHVYSEEPQGRFILVNLEKYREGETLASGLVLEEILPDGMVMSYQGERFRVEK
jgi:general secretion pathway protein B